jgi:hypothetical protein
MTTREEQMERVLDARIQARLATDPAYRNAETGDEQAEREREIEDEEIARYEAEASRPDCICRELGATGEQQVHTLCPADHEEAAR